MKNKNLISAFLFIVFWFTTYNMVFAQRTICDSGRKYKCQQTTYPDGTTSIVYKGDGDTITIILPEK